MTNIVQGEMVEVGDLQAEHEGTRGFVIRVDGTDRFVTVTGLTQDETRTAAKHFMDVVTLTVTP